MTYKEMQDEVLSLLMDQSSLILTGVPNYINTAIQQIAEDVRFPELRQVSSVTTSTTTYYVNMPTGFSSRLTYAGDSDGQYTILNTLEELIELYPALDETGDIQYVHCSGSILYYQPIPTVAATVTCIGYHIPALLVSDSDTPSFIPEFLQRETIVNRAAAIGYSFVEDGTEGNKVNTSLFTQLYLNGLNKLREYASRRRSVVSRSTWSV